MDAPTQAQRDEIAAALAQALATRTGPLYTAVAEIVQQQVQQLESRLASQLPVPTR